MRAPTNLQHTDGENRRLDYRASSILPGHSFPVNLRDSEQAAPSMFPAMAERLSEWQIRKIKEFSYFSNSINKTIRYISYGLTK